jgi:hypothetical protein
MATARSASAIQSKIQMILFGEQFTGKSTMASQFAYMKNTDQKPFRVLYLDPESGSIDDYLGTMEANGVNLANIYIVYTQSMTEVTDYIAKVKNNEDFYVLDDDGNETDEVVLDGDGKPFRPDAIVVDGTSVLNLTTQEGLVAFSKKRNKVKADMAGLVGDARLVKIDGAGLELKDYKTVNFAGQNLILSLNATGKHYIATCREADEKVYKEINGKEVSVVTGRKIPDGFKGMAYNCKTLIRMYRDSDDYDIVHAFVDKDRTGVHKAGEILDDPSLLDYQSIIDKTANNTHVVINNALNDAVEIEEKKYAKEAGIGDVAEEPADKGENVADLRKQIIAKINSESNPVKRSAAKKHIESKGLPTAFSKVEDKEILHKVLDELDVFMNG